MNLTEQDVLKSIVPKSDQLNADDLIAGPITVTVTGCKKLGDKNQPFELEIDGGHKPYRPCTTMRRIIVEAWGQKPQSWVGEKLTLFRWPDAMFKGVKVGGIRIAAMSGIKEPRTFVITVSRGTRMEWPVNPIAEDDNPHAKLIDAFSKLGVTLEQLEAHIGCSLDDASEIHIRELRAVFKEIQSGEREGL